MKRFLKKWIFRLGVLTAVVIAGAAAILVYRVATKDRVPDRVILEADFQRHYVEQSARRGPITWVTGRAPALRTPVEALLRAATDDRVEGLVARVGGAMDMGKVQELRDAVLAFRRSGKKAVAWAESFAGAGSGNRAYYLATAFDRVLLQPSGELALTGLHARTPFLGELLKKAGVRPRLAKREEYKTAANTVTQTEYTAPHREAQKALIQSMMDQILEGIASSRGVSEEEAASLVAGGPYLASEALERGLIDGLAYRDEVVSSIKEQAGDETPLLPLPEYRRRAGSPYRGKNRIGLIYGVGRIVRGKSRRSPLGGHIMGSDTVCSAFRDAVKDDSIEAVVFRIDSPGGSYVASDAIRREVFRAREAGKPVIVSMSGVAASGGYFVAVPADRILAHPGTITGSIGVLGGKMITRELWNKLGIHWGAVSTHENADLGSRTADYTERQWACLQERLDEIYRDFLARVSEGREMGRAEVREAARGRVWTGKDALALGLVDELGGLPQAVRAAKDAAGIPQEKPVGLALFPPRRTLWQQILGEGSRDGMNSLTLGPRLRQDVVTAARLLREMEGGMRNEALWMGPPLQIE